ncbi:ectoine hydroxylase [Maritalea mediterranea]|uniref:Ectoine hydroxylase n=1 Tax=Maritalea mediterranea TaxID=2909667 RepID=A0ABS9ECJ6_9HYPH|nr:ectoine hydroxylase [Maritalea mediterranea]MCF4099181.1 ectoine hydroxylase [Maritalea mediterranea]
MSSAAIKPIEQEDAYVTRLPSGERWLERKDPVVWSEWRPGAPLALDQVKKFERDGFLVLEDIFLPGEIDALIEESARLRSDATKLHQESLVTEPGTDDVRTIFDLDLQSEVFSRLAEDVRISEPVRFLLDDEIYVHQSRLNYKPGLTGKEFYWHSDFETWHAEDGMPRMRAISASILLTDNDALNGPLMLMPGSQNTFIACAGETPEDNHKTSLKQQKVGVPSAEALSKLAQDHGIEYAAGKKGTVILFDCNTMHGSNGNITPYPRSNAFFVYNAWSNQLEAPFGAAKPRPNFLGRRNPEEPVTLREGHIESTE